MSARQESRRFIAVGVDLGGTWIRALAITLDGARLRSFRGRAPDLERLPEFLRQLWRQWHVTRARLAGLVVATRGVWTLSERQRQERRLSKVARKVSVSSDAQVAYLGELGNTPGLLVLAGTGSIVLGRN
jgi:N-acetylglucosamine kinase-like BadF-type ATPase